MTNKFMKRRDKIRAQMKSRFYLVDFKFQVITIIIIDHLGRKFNQRITGQAFLALDFGGFGETLPPLMD